MLLPSRSVSDEQSEVIASRVGKHRPPAHMRNLRFGKHRFPSVRFDCNYCGVDVVSREGLKPYVRPAVTTDAIYAF